MLTFSYTLLTNQKKMNEEILDQNLSNNQLSITPEIKEFLRETAKWGKFLAIVGFVMMAFLVILGIFMGTFMGSMMAGMPDTAGLGGAMGGAIGFIYIIIALIYIFPLLYLYRFSTKVKVAIAQDDQQYLYESFLNLKSLFKFMGIFMAIIVGFYALIFVFGIFGGLASLAM